MVDLLLAAAPLTAAGVLIYVVWRLGRPHRTMHAEISARCVALRTPVSDPSVDGTVTTGAGTPDPAPVVARRRVGWWGDSVPAHRRVA